MRSSVPTSPPDPAPRPTDPAAPTRSRPDEAFAAAVAAAGRPAEGEQVLPTALGGPAAWDRACAVAATADRAESHAVVVIRTAVPGERAAGRSAAALRRSVRQHDVVCLVGPGTYAVLTLCCDENDAAELADRLVAALLDVGVGAASGSAADPDPFRGQSTATTRANEAWCARRPLEI